MMTILRLLVYEGIVKKVHPELNFQSEAKVIPSMQERGPIRAGRRNRSLNELGAPGQPWKDSTMYKLPSIRRAPCQRSEFL